MALTRDQILTAPDIRREEVQVPEWGGTVWVHGLTGAERDAFEASIIEQRDAKTVNIRLANLRARLCAIAIRDDLGKRVFSDADIAELGKKSAGALQRVFEAAQRLSALADGDVDRLAKNLSGEASAASGFASPQS
jgi:hypothetical protein